MSDVPVIQMVPMAEPRLTLRLAARVLRRGAWPMLDLEDGLWVPSDPEQTRRNRVAGRERLAACLALAPSGGGLGCRVNALESEDGEADLDWLAGHAPGGSLARIFVPKFEAAAPLRRWQQRMEQAGHGKLEWIPIVETRKGMERMEELAAQAHALGVRFLTYGHYDYSLDAGDWPFLNHDDGAYWDRARAFAGAAARGGLRYFHPPFPVFGDEPLLRALRARLQEEFPDGGVVTVTSDQTRVFREPDCGGILPHREPRATAPCDPLELARQVAALHGERRQQGFSFAQDPRSGRFISPHEALAARQVMEMESRPR